MHLRSLCGGPELGSVWVKVGHRGRWPRGTARYEISSHGAQLVLDLRHDERHCFIATCTFLSTRLLSR